MDLATLPVEELAVQLLTANALFHLHHLEANTHAEHLVLNEVYTSATEQADLILEQVLALAPTRLRDLQTLSCVRTTPMDDLGQLIQALMPFAAVDEPGLANVVQEAISVFSRLKYQLRLTMGSAVVM